MEDRRKAGVFWVGALAAGLVLAGCGGGETSDDQGSATTAPSATTAAAGDAGNLAVYCEKTIAIESDTGPEIDFSKLTPQQQTDASKKYVSEVVQPLARQIQAAAPASIRSDIDVLVRAVDEVATTGDFEAVFGRPEVERASATVHQHDLSACKFKRVDVTAVDYAFQGVPRTLEAGTVSFELTNSGKELHEIAVLKKKEGVTQSFDAILALPEEQGMARVTFKGAADGPPGKPNIYSVQQLDPGSYAMVCFLPVGGTPEATKAAKDAGKELQGPPHFTRGMKTEFTVT